MVNRRLYYSDGTPPRDTRADQARACEPLESVDVKNHHGRLAVVATGKSGCTGRRKVRALVYQISIMLCVAGSLAIINREAYGTPDQELLLVSRVVLISLIAQLAVLRLSFGTLLSPLVLYALLMSLFTSGWLLLKALSIEPATTDIVARLAPRLVLDAAKFYALGFSCFVLGVLVVGRPPKLRSSNSDIGWKDEETLLPSMRAVGWLCVAIGIVPFVAVSTHSLITVVTDGYSAYYTADARLDWTIAPLANFVLPGIVFLGTGTGRRGTVRAVLALVVVGGIWLLSGDRGGGFVVLLSALCLWAYTAPRQHRKRVKTRALFMYGSIAVALIPIIGAFRHAATTDNFAPVSLLVDQNPIVESLHTFGSTIWPLAQTMALVPSSVDFIRGGSFISSLLRLLPDFLIPSPFLEFASDPIYASPGVWLMERLGMTYGPGFTPFAEAYLNFGVVGGYLALLVFGILIALALRLDLDDSSPIRIAFVLSFFILCGMSVRGSANFLVPTVLRFICLPLVLVTLIAHRKVRNRTHQRRRTKVDRPV